MSGIYMDESVPYETRIAELSATIDECEARIEAARGHVSSEDRSRLWQHAATLVAILRKWREWYEPRSAAGQFVGYPSRREIFEQMRTVREIDHILSRALRN
jgi:hypothetical protein